MTCYQILIKIHISWLVVGYALCDEVLKLKVKHPNILTIITIPFMNQK
jgi:hypothetical protein